MSLGGETLGLSALTCLPGQDAHMRNKQQDLWQAALILRHYKVIAVKGHSVFACSYIFLSMTPHNWPVHFQS